jgi:hypothetical protein
MMLALIVLVVVPLAAQLPRFSDPAPSEYVHIDGSRNPEMIPEWSTWEFAFRTIAGGSKLIPTQVLQFLSGREAELLLEEALASQERDAACQARILRLKPLLTRETAKKIDERTREIQIECRWQTLHARDRLLAALEDNPEGQMALIQWVESTKSVTRVSVPKAELAHYRQPQ